MGDWYKSLLPEATSEDAIVLLYSMPTDVGELQVLTTVATFRISFVREPRAFALALNGVKGDRVFRDVCDAVVAASKHGTGITRWDWHGQQLSDYLPDWKVRVSQYLIINYIDLWIQRNPEGSLREMVDYFEHDPTHLVNRGNIADSLRQLIVSGQVKRLPRDWMTPAELDSVLRLAREYGVDVPGNRYT